MKINPAEDYNPSVFRVSGLEREVEIIVDTWGVPHIYAESDDDVFVAQGFNAARERLWQIDLWRRRGLGLLSEVFGEGYVRHDRAARLFLYRGDMDDEWSSYGPTTKRATERFVDGINQYVALTEREPEMLPPEFGRVGYRPAFWRAEDIARIRSHGLSANVTEELKRALVLRDFDAKVEGYRKRLEPDHDLTVPEGLDLTSLVPEILDEYVLATAAFTFPVGTPQQNRRIDEEGSNNWVLDGTRTTTGRAILANDPHRDLSLPSLRYLCHLCTPQMNVIGAGEPILPGISIGHNDRLAFGLTIFPIDQEDLYVYRTNENTPDKYWYDGSWESMVVEDIEISVKDRDPQRAQLKFTRHGPVVYEDRERGTAFAVKAAWLGPGMAPYLGSVEYMTAPTLEAFSSSLSRWGSPGENQVYADIEGNIGWKPAGRVPKRPNWDGLLPVPGDGTYEWDGFLNPASLPEIENPASGWIATANHMNLSPDFHVQERPVSFEWHADFRYRRLSQVLDSNRRWTVDELVELQSDVYSLPAETVTGILRRGDIASDDPKIRRAIASLTEWDCMLVPESNAAAIFEVWFKRFLRPAALRLELSEDEVCAITDEDEVGDSREVLSLLERYVLNSEASARSKANEAIVASLGKTIAYLESILGADNSTWTWGTLHHASFVHPLSALAPDESLDAGSVARGGSRDTVGNTAYRNADFRQTGGASFRIVVDVGEWDSSQAMNAPGQSGNPESPHYGGLVEQWARGSSFPLLYSKDRVEDAVYRRYRLLPQNQ